MLKPITESGSFKWGMLVVEELERSIDYILDANSREKRRFFFDKDNMEKDQMWFSGAKPQNIG